MFTDKQGVITVLYGNAELFFPYQLRSGFGPVNNCHIEVAVNASKKKQTVKTFRQR